ncbi:Clp protease ClpB [Bacillus infantis]|uniref:Clp protease ClpB n=1 Tax=Bacillus infantis TaxID=324767 RepID=UPI001CD740D4|nr:Clp protease ClpB [Bacillus infantis]MCA1041226.1 Clp protease ClpB [Bacillus infantis]
MKPLTCIIGVSILSLSIVISAFIIGNSIKSADKNGQTQPLTYSANDVMTINQLSGYLQISEDLIEKIIREDMSAKANLSTYDTYQFIPYLEIDEQKRFIKSEIDEWLKYKNNHTD